jgi:hypothetical protein
LVALDHLGNHGPLSVADTNRVDPVECHTDPEPGRPPGHLGHLGGLDHCFAGDAGDVDAASADHSLFDEDDRTACGRHLRGEGFAALASTDNGKLEMLGRTSTFLLTHGSLARAHVFQRRD